MIRLISNSDGLVTEIQVNVNIGNTLSRPWTYTSVPRLSFNVEAELSKLTYVED